MTDHPPDCWCWFCREERYLPPADVEDEDLDDGEDDR